jgi:hypothetical protein
MVCMSGCRPILMLLAALASVGGACATGSSTTTRASPHAPDAVGPARASHRPATGNQLPPRPADADADVAYYQERAAALTSVNSTEIARTDFARMRRGRLYSKEPPAASGAPMLGRALGEAFARSDDKAVIDITAQIIAGDQADIRAHILRAVVLHRTGRDVEATFHREVAIGLVESIVHSGDGRSFDTAWTVFRTKEEYEVLKAAGYLVNGQSLTTHGGRTFDILSARKANGNDSFRAHFDITELFIEESRAFQKP